MLTKVRVAWHTATAALEETDIRHGGNYQNFLKPCVPGYDLIYSLQCPSLAPPAAGCPWWRAQG